MSIPLFLPLVGPIRVGHNGDHVGRIQDRLNELGAAKPTALKADGKFGSRTREAVREFQRAKQLKVDGVVGPVTASAMGFSSYVSTPRLMAAISRIGASARSGNFAAIAASILPAGRDEPDLEETMLSAALVSAKSLDLCAKALASAGIPGLATTPTNLQDTLVQHIGALRRAIASPDVDESAALAHAAMQAVQAHNAINSMNLALQGVLDKIKSGTSTVRGVSAATAKSVLEYAAAGMSPTSAVERAVSAAGNSVASDPAAQEARKVLLAIAASAQVTRVIGSAVQMSRGVMQTLGAMTQEQRSRVQDQQLAWMNDLLAKASKILK